ncbi:MAG: Hsp20/alpha crystallin family protein [Nitrospirae bacterium]|nr:Hsp20/alpha crystallin family protein [Nitrospirota bacterium]
MAIRNLLPTISGRKGMRVKRDSDNPFEVLQRDMNSLFDNFFRGFGPETFESRMGLFTPQIDVSETDKEIRISAELPGMDEKDIEVSLSKDILTIKGEKKEEKEDKGKDYYRMERSYGSFSRTIPLPVEVQDNKVDATFKKGVLTITLPKSEKAVKETKKVAIKAE